MSLKARLYIATVVTLGGGMLLGAALADPRLPDLPRFLQCLLLAVLASTFKTRLPGMQSSISLNFVVFIIGIAALSPFETLLMASAGTTVQTLWRARTRPKLVQVLFNVGALLVSLFTAIELTAALREAARVPGLVAAGAVLFLMNSWLVSVVLSLVKGGSPVEIWRTCHCWTFPYYVAGAVLAVVVSTSAAACGWTAAFAMLPTACLVYAYYESLMKRAGFNRGLFN